MILRDKYKALQCHHLLFAFGLINGHSISNLNKASPVVWGGCGWIPLISFGLTLGVCCQHLIALSRYFHYEVLLRHLEIAAIVWIDARVVGHETEVMVVAHRREVIHLCAFIRFLTHLVDRSHLSVVAWSVFVSIEKVDCLHISVSEHSLLSLLTIEVASSSGRWVWFRRYTRRDFRLKIRVTNLLDFYLWVRAQLRFSTVWLLVFLYLCVTTAFGPISNHKKLKSLLYWIQKPTYCLT